MNELVIIIWAILLVISLLYFAFLVKRYQIKLNAYFAWHKILGLFLISVISFLIYYYFKNSDWAQQKNNWRHIIWINRLVFFTLGVLNVYIIYKYPWTKRDKFNFTKDSFLPEFILQLIMGLMASIVFVVFPQAIGLVDRSLDLSIAKWDYPLIFIYPFILIKFIDSISQIPFKTVENQWVYPLEPINPDKWPWRNLLQVNFQLKRNLYDEYRFFSWPVHPWIEAPMEVQLGDVFRLLIQERRNKRSLSTIQDLGIEYGGKPTFCWLFNIKMKWWDFRTWFRTNRYVNPNLSIEANGIRRWDTIVARRVPLIDQQEYLFTNRSYTDHFDPDKTTIISR